MGPLNIHVPPPPPNPPPLPPRPRARSTETRPRHRLAECPLLLSMFDASAASTQPSRTAILDAWRPLGMPQRLITPHSGMLTPVSPRVIADVGPSPSRLGRPACGHAGSPIMWSGSRSRAPAAATRTAAIRCLRHRARQGERFLPCRARERADRGRSPRGGGSRRRHPQLQLERDLSPHLPRPPLRGAIRLRDRTVRALRSTHRGA